jgi:hypothetical protein
MEEFLRPSSWRSYVSGPVARPDNRMLLPKCKGSGELSGVVIAIVSTHPTTESKRLRRLEM